MSGLQPDHQPRCRQQRKFQGQLQLWSTLPRPKTGPPDTQAHLSAALIMRWNLGFVIACVKSRVGELSAQAEPSHLLQHGPGTHDAAAMPQGNATS